MTHYCDYRIGITLQPTFQLKLLPKMPWMIALNKLQPYPWNTSANHLNHCFEKMLDDGEGTIEWESVRISFRASLGWKNTIRNQSQAGNAACSASGALWTPGRRICLVQTPVSRVIGELTLPHPRTKHLWNSNQKQNGIWSFHVRDRSFFTLYMIWVYHRLPSNSYLPHWKGSGSAFMWFACSQWSWQNGRMHFWLQWFSANVENQLLKKKTTAWKTRSEDCTK